MISSSVGLAGHTLLLPKASSPLPARAVGARKRGTVSRVVASWTTGGIAAVAVLTPVGLLFGDRRGGPMSFVLAIGLTY
jgi:hypothetical protein